jgi:hypothetical protein
MEPFWMKMAFSLLMLLSTTTTSTSANPEPDYRDWDYRISDSIRDATKWIEWSKSMERRKESDPCNAFPSLSYLRSHVQLLLVSYDPSNTTKFRHHYSFNKAVELLGLQPLVYSFYVQKVLQPYCSRLPEANASSFCLLDIYSCRDKKDPDCRVRRNAAICMPNSDNTTEGRCVTCDHLNAEIEKAKANFTMRDEKRIGYLLDTCEPVRSRGPKPVPQRKAGDEKNATKEVVRYLRWFLESSFVFEKKKAKDECSASGELSKARVPTWKFL